MKEELQKINLNLQSKIELWLTYKEVKPASFISIHLENGGNSDITNDVANLKAWTDKAGLFCIQDEEQKESFYVSKDVDKARELSKIMWNEDEDSVYRKGILFGYPQNAVKHFSENIEQIDNGSKIFMQVGLIPGDSFGTFLTYDWYPYIRYIVRERNIDEDVQVAMEWARICRKDIPVIAKEFEEEMRQIHRWISSS